VVQGDVLMQDSSNTLAMSDGRLIACVGVDNLIVVETADAVLVAHKDKTQDVKKIVDRLKQAGRSEGQMHRKVFRPWGWYDSIEAGPRFQVKRIVVKPGGILSLQMHHHRAEHWIVVSGTAKALTDPTTGLRVRKLGVAGPSAASLISRPAECSPVVKTCRACRT
jgi:mannose-1-phosphate guanylyltransferase/mannose-6-phosphate isomerase